jgi:tetratricopeptide (TPR) repeat protein
MAPAALTAQPAQLWHDGDFAAAYESAAPQQTLPLQLLAARSAIDQVVYVLAPAGADLPEQLVWLRRAVSAAEQAVRLDAGSAAAVMALARAKGEVARRSGVLQNLNVAGELKQLFDQALALEPNNPDALVGLAMWHLELVQAGVGWLYGGKRDAVLPLLEKGVAAAPEQINLRNEYATALLALGTAAQAEQQLRVALQLTPHTAVDRAEQRRSAELLLTLP